jgi:hypothetical protein
MSKAINQTDRSRSQIVTLKRGENIKYRPYAKRVGKHDNEIAANIDAIRQLMAPPAKPRREIGFHVREGAPRYRTRKAFGCNDRHD